MSDYLSTLALRATQPAGMLHPRRPAAFEPIAAAADPFSAVHGVHHPADAGANDSEHRAEGVSERANPREYIGDRISTDIISPTISPEFPEEMRAPERIPPSSIRVTRATAVRDDDVPADDRRARPAPIDPPSITALPIGDVGASISAVVPGQRHRETVQAVPPPVMGHAFMPAGGALRPADIDAPSPGHAADTPTAIGEIIHNERGSEPSPIFPAAFPAAASPLAAFSDDVERPGREARGALVPRVPESPPTAGVLLAPREHHASMERPEAPAPTVVHVTIGRIEVRAVMPPPAARAASTPARTAARTSLDEFLRSQKRGYR